MTDTWEADDHVPDDPDLEVIDLDDEREQPPGQLPRVQLDRDERHSGVRRRPIRGHRARWQLVIVALVVAAVSAGTAVALAMKVTH